MLRRLFFYSLTIVAMMAGMLIVCQAQSKPPLTRHVRDVIPNGQARSVGRLSATQSMSLDMVLPLRNQAELENFLRDVYDPSSPFYHHFLTVPEFTARFGPSQEDYDAVVRFAKCERLHGSWRLPRRHGRADHGVGGGHRGSLPCDHGCLPAPHGKPHILCS